MTTPNVAVKVSGEDVGVSQLLRTLSKQLKDLEAVQARSGRATGVAGSSARKAAGDFSALERSQRSALSSAGALASKLAGLAAAYVSIRSVVAAVAKGLDVNAQLESSALGIATIITAQGKLTDAQSKTLTGAEALNAAQAISADQLQKLRVAGLQTSATFVDLSRAFQTATGPGLAAGLSLDEVRETTIGLTQAAGALGVPFNQLDQEIRSILAGEIDINSRVANTLDITNEQVKRERERGTLAVFLNEKFAAFNLAGIKAAATFAGVTSNLGDALSLLAADATRPLFESFKKAGIAAIEGVFDLKNAKIAPAFQGVVTLAQDAFAGLGDLLARAIAGAVDGAKRLSAFIRLNREQITAFAQRVAAAATALGAAVVQAGRIAFELGRAAIESGVVSAALRTIELVAKIAAGAMKLLADNVAVVVLALSAGAIFKGIAAFTALAAAARSAAAGFIIISSPALAAVAAVTAVGIALASVGLAVEKYRERQDALNRASAVAATNAPVLIAQYRKIASALADGTLKGLEAEKAQQKLNDLRAALIALSPSFQSALKNETSNMNGFADAAERAAEAELQLNKQKLVTAQTRVAEVESKLAEAEANLDRRFSEANVAAVATATAQAQRARGELDRLAKAFEGTALAFRAIAPVDDLGFAVAKNLGNIDKGGGATLSGKPKKTGAADDARASARALADARVREIEREIARTRELAESALKDREQLNEQANDRGTLSLTQYFDRRAAIIREGTAAEVGALEAQLAQLRARPIVPDATGSAAAQAARVKRATEEADLVQQITLRRAEGDRQLKASDFARVQSTEQIARAIESSEAKVRAARGDTLADTLANIRTESEAYRRELVLRGDADVEVKVKVFVDTLSANAAFADLQAQGQRALDALGRDRQSIEAQAATGVISQAQAQRDMLALEQQRAPLVQRIAAALVLSAASLGPEQQAQAAAYAAEIARIGTSATRASLLAKNAFSNIGDSLEDSLGDTLSRLGNDIQTFGGFFTALAQTAVQAIQRIVAQLLAARIVQGIAGAFLGGGGGGSGIGQVIGLSSAGVSAAAGGYIRGPGTGTSDSIRAWLSNGEYVMPARTVEHYGVAAMDAIRAIRSPVRRSPPSGGQRYAEGGLVSGGAGGRSELAATIGLEDGLVVRTLASRAGESAQLDFVRKNARAIKALLR